jgi:exodeoxyribonuclease VII small subunit
MSDATVVSFEHGYGRLQEIAGRLNSEEVPVHEMCDLFAEGKGLEKALTGYLDTQKARVEEIERGEGIQIFRVEAPGQDAPEPIAEVPADTSDFESTAPAAQDGSAAAGSSGDDIPF